MSKRNKREKGRGLSRPRTLRMEQLESRQMLSGVVNVYTQTVAGGPTVTAGDVYLVGDGSNNSVKMQSTSTYGDFSISSGDGSTYFRLNTSTGAPTLTLAPLDGVTGSVHVNLGAGNDAFDFEPPSGTGVPTVSTVLGSLVITNGPNDTNTVNDVVINGNLQVAKSPSTIGFSQLTVTGSTILGYANINNGTPGGTTGGDSYTSISNTLIQGGSSGSTAPVALTISNGDGNNQNWIQGTTQIGTAPLNAANNAVVITDGAGGSESVFTGTASTSAPVVYGGVLLTNGQCLPLQTNAATFFNTQVLGAVTLNDTAGGDTQTNVKSSTLGAQLNLGGPLDVNNSAGNNIFSMVGSQLPWGLSLNNPATSTLGTQTIIDSSYIGQTKTGARPLVLAVPNGVAGDAAFIQDGTGPDTVIVRNGTIVNGALDMAKLGSGIKDVDLDSSTMTAVNLVTGAGLDQVWIGGDTIQNELNVNLGTGTNTVYLQKGNTDATANSLPSLLDGGVSIVGGLGTNTLDYDPAAGALPADIVNFQYVSGVVALPSWGLLANL